MSAERKKVDPKPINKVEPKKRVEPKQVEKPTPKKREETVEQTTPKKMVIPSKTSDEPKTKKSENKYVRIALDAKQEERNEFSQKVKNGELKYAYYATDNDKGYHYYLVIKK
jgi:hypothetical protein